MSDKNAIGVAPEINASLLQDYFKLAKKNNLYSEFYKDIPSADEAPMLSKNELIPILKTRFKLHEETSGVYLVRSGGSTQDPLVFPVDIEENQNQRMAMAKELTENRFFTPKTIALNIFGYSDMYRTAAIMDDILEKCQATTLALSAHASYRDMQKAAHYFKPNFILGTPSKLVHLAKFLESDNQRLDIPNLFFAGEFLRPASLPFLQKMIGFQQIYSMYGSAETGIWAWSDYSKRPSLFSVIEGVIVEILEPDYDGYGTIAVTNTFRRRFPVFRYAIGDIGRWVYEDGKAYLELKSRESKSFIMGEQHYDLDILIPIINKAEAYQLQLSNNEEFQEIIRLLIVEEVSEEQQLNFIHQKTEQLKNILNYTKRFMKIEVVVVNTDQLYTDPNTAKTPLLLDLR